MKLKTLKFFEIGKNLKHKTQHAFVCTNDLNLGHSHTLNKSSNWLSLEVGHPLRLIFAKNLKDMTLKFCLSYDVTSRIEITPCNKIDKPL